MLFKKIKAKTAGRTGNDGTKNVINLILTWSARCFIIDDPIAVQEPTFTISDTKLYLHVVTLSTQDNAELLQQLK